MLTSGSVSCFLSGLSLYIALPVAVVDVEVLFESGV
jgi:hypothetical protein